MSKDLQKTLGQETKKLEDEIKELEKGNDSVRQYKKTAESFSDVMKYRRNLRAFKRPQTGNIVTRNLKKIVLSFSKKNRRDNKGNTKNKSYNKQVIRTG